MSDFRKRKRRCYERTGMALREDLTQHTRSYLRIETARCITAGGPHNGPAPFMAFRTLRYERDHLQTSAECLSRHAFNVYRNSRSMFYHSEILFVYSPPATQTNVLCAKCLRHYTKIIDRWHLVKMAKGFTRLRRGLNCPSLRLLCAKSCSSCGPLYPSTNGSFLVSAEEYAVRTTQEPQ